jgi:hypothetical protein
MKPNTLRLVFLALFFILLPNFTPAQKYLFSKNYWHKGQVVLKSGRTYSGLVKYHLKYNLVELKQEGKALTKTFSSTQLEQFSIFDTLTKVERNFYALPMKTASNYSPNFFFELIDEGDFSILSREQIIMKPHNKGLDLKGSGKYDLVLEDEFFILNEQGKVESCGKAMELSSKLSIPMRELKDYIKTNKINLRQRTDYMNVINHFGIYTKKYDMKERLLINNK